MPRRKTDSWHGGVARGTPREKTNMSRRTVTANYQSSFSPENIGGKAVRDISKAADLVNDSAFRSGHRKLTVWRTNFMKNFLLYLGGVSLAVLPIRAEAGPHHGGMH